jgi:hypothetical protein
MAVIFVVNAIFADPEETLKCLLLFFEQKLLFVKYHKLEQNVLFWGMITIIIQQSKISEAHTIS